MAITNAVAQGFAQQVRESPGTQGTKNLWRRKLASGLLAAGAAAALVSCGTAGPPLVPGDGASHITTRALIEAVTPYVSLSEDYRLAVDEAQARAAGVPEDAIRLAIEIAVINNDVVDNPDRFVEAIDPEGLATVEEFFFSVANGLPDEAAAAESESSVPVERDKRQFVCGGGPDQPHPCPAWKSVTRRWNSRQAVAGYLTSSGYHLTAGYASYNNANDYTLCVSANGCSGCRFRTQAIIQGSGGNWAYQYQTPEPNPEILSYVWPAWWWGSYVRWWHQNFC